MGLFRRAAAPTVDQAELNRWRGRSAEILDAGPMPWQTVLEALKTAPQTEPDDGDDFRAWFMAALGLNFVEVNNRGSSGGFDGNYTSRETDIYYGQRYGRPVMMNIGNQRTGQLGAMVTWVSAATPAISITGSKGRLSVDGSAPGAVVAFVGSLTEQPKLWNNLHLVAGDEGVVVKRPMKTFVHPQGWIYDLWLAEHVAHLAGYTVLAQPDHLSTYLPYGLARTHAR